MAGQTPGKGVPPRASRGVSTKPGMIGAGADPYRSPSGMKTIPHWNEVITKSNFAGHFGWRHFGANRRHRRQPAVPPAMRDHHRGDSLDNHLMDRTGGGTARQDQHARPQSIDTTLYRRYRFHHGGMDR